MKVTLAVAHDGKKPDTTVELPDAVAKTLISQGRARVAEESKQEAPSKADKAVQEKVAQDTKAADAG